MSPETEKMARRLLGPGMGAGFVWPDRKAAGLMAEWICDGSISDADLIGLFGYLFEKAGLREAAQKYGFQRIWTADCEDWRSAEPFLHFCLDRPEFCIWMAKQGAGDVNARDADGETLLLASAVSPEVGLWLAANRDVDMQACGYSGMNLLHCMAWRDLDEKGMALCEAAMAAGLDPVSKGRAGKSPAEMALGYSNDGCSHFLISKAGAGISADSLEVLGGLAREKGCVRSAELLDALSRARIDAQAVALASAGPAARRAKASGI